MYLLDTDICIFALRDRAPQVIQRLDELGPGDVGVTTITTAELMFGALHSRRPKANAGRVVTMLASLEQLAFDDYAALQFARIKAELSVRGQLIGDLDMLIAATACAAGATLVTNNVSEFERVEGLAVENWMS